MVGFRKLMDFFPSVFSQNDLFWLDNLMPASNKKKKEKKNGLSKVGTSEVCENYAKIFFHLFKQKIISGVGKP